MTVEGATYLKNNINLSRTDNPANPFIYLTSSSGSAYLQLNGTSIGIGNGWTNSLTIDNTGNATLPGNMTAEKFIGPLQGNASTATSATSATSALQLAGWADTRAEATAPNDYNGKLKVVGIKQKSLMDIDGSNYSTLMGIRGWSDSSGGNSHELAFTGSGNLYHRHGATTSWGSWNRIPMCGTANTFSGINTFTGQVILTRTTDASGTANNKPALTIGSSSGTHLELDGNEIMAKASGTTTGPIYINNDGGAVTLGGATTIKSTLTVNSIPNMTSVPTKYYVDNGSGKLSYRTREQMQSDVGGGAGTFKAYIDSLKE